MSTEIECKLQRKGGTEVKLDKTTYHFAPREDGAHVADVENEAHVDKFLSIPEGYRMYRGQAAAAPIEPAAPVTPADVIEPVAANIADTILLGSSVHPATFNINGKTYALGDVVALAQAATGLNVAEWNELDDASRADMIDEQLELLNADTSGDGVVDPSEERAALAAQYRDKFDKAPHGKWTIERIREELAKA